MYIIDLTFSGDNDFTFTVNQWLRFCGLIEGRTSGCASALWSTYATCSKHCCRSSQVLWFMVQSLASWRLKHVARWRYVREDGHQVKLSTDREEASNLQRTFGLKKSGETLLQLIVFPYP